MAVFVPSFPCLFVAGQFPYAQCLNIEAGTDPLSCSTLLPAPDGFFKTPGLGMSSRVSQIDSEDNAAIALGQYSFSSSVGDNIVVLIMDLPSGTPRARLGFHSWGIFGLVGLRTAGSMWNSPSLLAVGDKMTNVSIWNCDASVRVAKVPDPPPLTRRIVQRGGTEILIGGNGVSTVIRFDVEHCTTLGRFSDSDVVRATTYGIAMFKDTPSLFYTVEIENRVLRRWSIDGPQSRSLDTVRRGSVGFSLLKSADERYLIVGGQKEVEVWDPRKLESPIFEFDTEPGSAVWDQGHLVGTKYVAICQNGKAHSTVWDLMSGKVTETHAFESACFGCCVVRDDVDLVDHLADEEERIGFLGEMRVGESLRIVLGPAHQSSAISSLTAPVWAIVSLEAV